MPLVGARAAGTAGFGGFGGGGKGFITATGGTITESGDFRIHTFTSGGTFAVSKLGTGPTGDLANFLIVAGGGNSGTNSEGAGAGAGGFREFSCQPISASSYPISVGGPGGESSGFGFTSNRGGQGGSQFTGGQPGGSGGGAGFNGGGAASGNQPPVSPPQGNPGGTGRICGGGGAGASGFPGIVIVTYRYK